MHEESVENSTGRIVPAKINGHRAVPFLGVGKHTPIGTKAAPPIRTCAGYPDDGDKVVSDLAAALSGSMGVAPTANLNPPGDFPSMFEPIHGSAFDIMGKGIANPIGAFWTAALMLEHLGEDGAADKLMTAVGRVTAAGETLPPDLGGRATTRDVTDAVIAAIRASND